MIKPHIFAQVRVIDERQSGGLYRVGDVGVVVDASRVAALYVQFPQHAPNNPVYMYTNEIEVVE